MENPYLKLFYWLDNRWESWKLWEIRQKAVRKYAWAIPNEAAIKAIKQVVNGNGIVEIGAGTGYWAWLLSQAGIDVKAYDISPAGQWYPVVKGTEVWVLEHPERALMLCWPPYDDSMATSALENYEGDTLIYIGEGTGGCTGDDEFHHLLGGDAWSYERDEMITYDSEQKLITDVKIPQWEGLHDSLYIYKR